MLIGAFWIFQAALMLASAPLREKSFFGVRATERKRSLLSLDPNPVTEYPLPVELLQSTAVNLDFRSFIAFSLASRALFRSIRTPVMKGHFLKQLLEGLASQTTESSRKVPEEISALALAAFQWFLKSERLGWQEILAGLALIAVSFPNVPGIHERSAKLHYGQLSQEESRIYGKLSGAALCPAAKDSMVKGLLDALETDKIDVDQDQAASSMDEHNGQDDDDVEMAGDKDFLVEWEWEPRGGEDEPRIW